MSPEEAFSCSIQRPFLLTSFLRSGPIWAADRGFLRIAGQDVLPDKSIIFGWTRAQASFHIATPGGVSSFSGRRTFKGRDDLHNLDGILMANACIMSRTKPAFLPGLKARLNPGGIFPHCRIRYRPARAGWVPYPASFASLHNSFRDAGYPGSESSPPIPPSITAGDVCRIH